MSPLEADKVSVKKGTSVFWRIVISVIGILMLLIALNDISLNILGRSAVATVSTRRTGGANTGAAPERQYTWSIDYTFTADGKEYAGSTSAKGSAMSVEHGNVVKYYSFAPFINSLEAGGSPWLSSIIMGGLGVLLIVVMNGPKKKTKLRRKAVKKEPNIIERGVKECGGKVTMSWLMNNNSEYDDSIEEYYQNGWDKDDPSWQCSCGKWNDKEYCSSCGLPRVK